MVSSASDSEALSDLINLQIISYKIPFQLYFYCNSEHLDNLSFSCNSNDPQLTYTAGDCITGETHYGQPIEMINVCPWRQAGTYLCNINWSFFVFPPCCLTTAGHQRSRRLEQKHDELFNSIVALLSIQYPLMCRNVRSRSVEWFSISTFCVIEDLALLWETCGRRVF